jgi:hypothetical protein
MGEAGAFVVKVEPPPLPLCVVARHCARGVQLPVGISHDERQPAGAHRPTHSCLARGDRVLLRAEQVDPKVPIHWDPQEPLADAEEGGRLRDALGEKL